MPNTAVSFFFEYLSGPLNTKQWILLGSECETHLDFLFSERMDTLLCYCVMSRTYVRRTQ